MITTGDDGDEVDDVLRELDNEEGASGLENGRIQFFLRHQPLFAEWQPLPDETWAEVARSLGDLREEVADGLGAEAGFEIGVRVVGEDRRGPVLFRPTWCLVSPGEPTVGFLIGWDRRPDPTGTWPTATRPYRGILCATTTPEGRRLRETLKPLAASRLKGGDARFDGFQEGINWSVYGRFEPATKWWEDVPGWRAGIVKSFLAAAGVWAPVIDQAVEVYRGYASAEADA